MNPIPTVRPYGYVGAHRSEVKPLHRHLADTVSDSVNALRTDIPLRRKVTLAAAAVLLTIVGTIVAWPTPARASLGDYTTPIRGMFLYDDSFRHVNDHYHPTLVGYDDTNPTHVASTVDALKQARMQVAIMTWWGRGQHGEQATFPVLYGEAAAKGLGVIPYYEPEGQGNPSVAQIQTDLAYLRSYADANPGAAVRIGGKPVIFVYNAGSTGCAEVTKWKTATNGFTTAYVNMKVFSGFRTCPDQPSSWHQYGPAVAESVHLPWSFNISPGFWHHNESTPRLVRDPARWATNVAHLKASGAQWQLVTSYNEWGEATSVETSPSWASPSGYGTYIDELHNQLGPAPAPSPTATGSPSPSPTVTASPTGSPSPTPPPSGDTITVLAAGDIVDTPPCSGYTSGCQDGWTAELIGKYNPDAVLALGDLQYEQGSPAQFTAGWGRTTCAAPTDCDAWGKHLGVMYPAPGNHEWLTSNAAGYRGYLGARLAAIGSDTPSPNPQLYYSFDRGGWHFVSLDSDCGPVGGCGANRPMTNWLIADLAANQGRPTIVYYHHATWSSGSHGSRSDHEELKRIVYADPDVQMVLAGHDHEYERFAPMGQSGPDPTGARYFVVGTGGKGAVCGGGPIPGTVVKNCTTMGLLRLVLRPDGYSWQFHPTAEVGGPASTFTDSGSSGLRGAPSPGTSPSPTPSSSPTAVPSPSTTPTSTPPPPPAGTCVKPNATNTGPGSTVLTPSGGLTIGSGQTITGRDITGHVTINSGGVLLNSRIRGTLELHGTARAEYVEVDANGAGFAVFAQGNSAGARSVIRHANIYDGSDGARFDGFVEMTNSWIHDLTRTEGAHGDGVQATHGSYQTHVCNVVEGGNTSSFIMDGSGHVIFDHNWFIGTTGVGGQTSYAVYTAGVDFQFTNNVFSRVGGTVEDSANAVTEWTGNVFTDGAAVPHP